MKKQTTRYRIDPVKGRQALAATGVKPMSIYQEVMSAYDKRFGNLPNESSAKRWIAGDMTCSSEVLEIVCDALKAEAKDLLMSATEQAYLAPGTAAQEELANLVVQILPRDRNTLQLSQANQALSFTLKVFFDDVFTEWHDPVTGMTYSGYVNLISARLAFVRDEGIDREELDMICYSQHPPEGHLTVQEFGPFMWKIDNVERSRPLKGNLRISELFTARGQYAASDRWVLACRPECLRVPSIEPAEDSAAETTRIKSGIKRRILERALQAELMTGEPRDDGVWVLCQSNLW